MTDTFYTIYYERGYDDHIDGVYTNPYQDGTPEHDEWLDGATDAHDFVCMAPDGYED